MVENPRVSHVQLADITKKSKEAIRINVILKQIGVNYDVATSIMDANL